MIHRLLSYAKSHIYELHALLAAFLAFLIMFRIKPVLKTELDFYVEKKAQVSRTWQQNGRTYRRRLGLLFVILDFIIAGIIFSVLSVLSPLIYFSYKMIYLSGVLSLTLYAVYDQLFSREGGENHE